MRPATSRAFSNFRPIRTVPTTTSLVQMKPDVLDPPTLPQRLLRIALVGVLIVLVLIDQTSTDTADRPTWLLVGSLVILALGATTLLSPNWIRALSTRHTDTTASRRPQLLGAESAIIVVALLSLTATTASTIIGPFTAFFGLPEAAVLLLLVLVAARRGHGVAGIAALVLADAALVLLPFRTAYLEYPQNRTTNMMLFALLLAVAVALGMWARSVDDKRRRAIESAREHERTSVAADVHDIVAHHLTSVLLQAQVARMMLDTDPAGVAPLLADIEKEASEALRSVRAVIGGLREPDSTTELAPTESLSTLHTLAGKAGGPHVEFYAASDAGTLPLAIQSALFRITREALTNIRRHSPEATTAYVRITRSDTAATLEVFDDAPVVKSTVKSGGLGLTSMRTRTETLGGTFDAGAAADGRWRVRADIPVGTALS